MNGRQAKRLRRAAMGLAVTMTEAGKDIKKDGYVAIKHENRFKPIATSSSDPGDKEPVVPVQYQVLVRPDSVKGIYRRLKSGRA